MVSAALPVLGDVAWDDWRDWLPLAVSLLTLVAALCAWGFAAKAARRAARQADAALRQARSFDEQVAIAREALALARREAQDARSDADRQRQETDRTRRTLEACQLTAGGQDRWRPLGGQLAVGRDQTFAFRTALTLWFENVSDRAAQV